MAKRLWSVFCDDMNRCIFTGTTRNIERHHIFGGPNRARSEKYGFVVPLADYMHPNGVHAGEKGIVGADTDAIDRMLKWKAFQWYRENIGTEEEFISEFGFSVEEPATEKVF